MGQACRRLCDGRNSCRWLRVVMKGARAERPYVLMLIRRHSGDSWETSRALSVGNTCGGSAVQ